MTDERSGLHEPVTYYAFAEEVTAFLPDAGLDGPDGTPLHDPPSFLTNPSSGDASAAYARAISPL